ncbi:MAG: hypothetical protein ACRC68_07380 [Clostridium sp.]
MKNRLGSYDQEGGVILNFKYVGYLFCFTISVILFYRGYLMYQGKNKFYKYENRNIKDMYKLCKYHGILLCVGTTLYTGLIFASMMESKLLEKLIVYGAVILLLIMSVFYYMILNKYTTKK